MSPAVDGTEDADRVRQYAEGPSTAEPARPVEDRESSPGWYSEAELQNRIDATRERYYAEGVRVGQAQQEAREFDFAVEDTAPSPYQLACESVHAASRMVTPVNPDGYGDAELEGAAHRARKAAVIIADGLANWLAEQIDGVDSDLIVEARKGETIEDVWQRRPGYRVLHNGTVHPMEMPPISLPKAEAFAQGETEIVDLRCPECRAGKHDNCPGWSLNNDEEIDCPCKVLGHL